MYKRASADQLLKHKWLKLDAAALAGNTIDTTALKEFNAKRKVRRERLGSRDDVVMGTLSAFMICPLTRFGYFLQLKSVGKAVIGINRMKNAVNAFSTPKTSSVKP